MFRSLYIYGHLIIVAFSLLMALAYVLMARRRGNRRDYWFVAIFVASALVGMVEMLQSLRPVPAAAQVQLALYGVIFLFSTVTFQVQFAAEVLPATRRRRYRLGVLGYAAFVVALLSLLLSGHLTSGVRVVELWGATSMVVDASPMATLWMATIALGNVALSTEVLLRSGPRQAERRIFAIPMLLSPLCALHELTLVADVGPAALPIGGYFCALLGVQGMMTLVARLDRADPAPRPAGELAGFTLIRRLGAGGMAEVFLARRRLSAGSVDVEQRVAVKRLLPGHADDPRFVAMFVDEARLIARLRHPHIVALHEVGHEDGQLYVAMELVDGPALSRIVRLPAIRGQGLPTAVVAEIGIQIADALGHAHALHGEDGRPLNLVHRDVSPQNILVDRSGIVKLTDFGIARTDARQAQTTTGVIKGKLLYVAPEQIRSEPYDHRADLYALGVVLFELATGRTPFNAPSDAALLFQIVEGRPALGLLAGVDPVLAAAIQRALAAAPGDRQASAAALIDELEPVRDERTARRELARLARRAAAADLNPAEQAAGTEQAELTEQTVQTEQTVRPDEPTDHTAKTLLDASAQRRHRR